MERDGDSEAAQCRRLWLAVIERLALDAAHPIERIRNHHDRSVPLRDRRQARLWIKSRSFDEVCALAGLDPAWARQTLAERLQ